MSATKTIVIGKNSPMSLAGRGDDGKKSSRVGPKYFEVFLSRVDINEADESIMEHLKMLKLNFRDFKQLNTQQTHYLSFYFKVDYNQKDIVLDEYNWPHKVLVREYVRTYATFRN